MLEQRVVATGLDLLTVLRFVVTKTPWCNSWGLLRQPPAWYLNSLIHYVYIYWTRLTQVKRDFWSLDVIQKLWLTFQKIKGFFLWRLFWLISKLIQIPQNFSFLFDRKLWLILIYSYNHLGQYSIAYTVKDILKFYDLKFVNTFKIPYFKK